MEEAKISRSGLAQRLQTSRSQVDSVLDPDNTSITQELLERLAHAVGKESQDRAVPNLIKAPPKIELA